MQISITVRSTVSGAQWVSVGECENEDGVQRGIAAAFAAFRSQHPKNPPFEWKLTVEKA